MKHLVEFAVVASVGHKREGLQGEKVAFRPPRRILGKRVVGKKS